MIKIFFEKSCTLNELALDVFDMEHPIRNRGYQLRILAAIRLVKYFRLFCSKQAATIETIPNAIDVYHTNRKAYAYASRDPKVAAVIISVVTPGSSDSDAGALINVPTNVSALAGARPA